MSQIDKSLTTCNHKQFVSHEQRRNGGPGFWLFCNRPIEDAATDMLRSAIRAYKPVPSVYGERSRTMLGNKRTAIIQTV